MSPEELVRAIALAPPVLPPAPMTKDERRAALRAAVQEQKQRDADQCSSDVLAVLAKYPGAYIRPARTESANAAGQTVIAWSWSIVVE